MCIITTSLLDLLREQSMEEEETWEGQWSFSSIQSPQGVSNVCLWIVELVLGSHSSVL